MEIKLAGYNVEADLLEKLKPAENEPLTPETISCAYARISRSPKSIIQLRKQAREDVGKARNSNKAIIFEMGHHSVAEHAVFNFDIIGVSRLALEEIERFRLASYTEKSQRYVTLKGDYHIPKEITEETDKKQFRDTVELQNQFYEKAFSILKEYLFDKYPEKITDKSEKKVVAGWAKEDARYILSLATEGQVGLTLNARNLEHVFRRFRLSRRTEVKEIGDTMFKRVEKIAPSLILFPEPSAFEKKLAQSFGPYMKSYINRYLKETVPSAAPLDAKTAHTLQNNPEIIEYTLDGDDRVLAALLVYGTGMEYLAALETVKNMEPHAKESIVKSLFNEMEFYDTPPREFELPDITFQAVVSASNFAQLKRHRMASLLTGEYNTDFGNIIPENIKITGLENEFNEIIDTTNGVYNNLKEKYNDAADYILTNSHCRSVIMKMNIREAYHFVRLRDDAHAQWDIRTLANNLLQKIKPLMPLTTLLLCGKSQYEQTYESLYGNKPKTLIRDNIAVLKD